MRLSRAGRQPPSPRPAAARSAPGDERSLRAEIERLLSGRSAEAHGRPVGVRRRPFDYRSTHALDELTVQWEDGHRSRLLLKGCGRRALRDGLGVRPRHCFDPYRELWTYEHLLRPLAAAAPAFHGTVHLGDREERMVLEKISGCPLYEVGDLETWMAASRWAAGFHVRARTIVDAPRLGRQLMIQDEHLLRRWLILARRRAVRGSGTLAATELERIEDPYETAVDILASRPRTVLHGELYPSNLMVERTGHTVAIRPVDWEWTAIGPAELDLAALTAGDWPDRDRSALLRAYREEAGVRSSDPDAGEHERALRAARLVLAVQWLGWAEEWTPPVHHARDWLQEARDAAADLRNPGTRKRKR